MKKLSNIRRGIALLVIVFGTLYLLDLPFLKSNFFSFFTSIQLVPALLSGALLVLLVLFILTALLGRIYCSVICPLGIFQDIIIYFKRRRVQKNKELRKKRRRYQYEAPKNKLRYGILLLVVISLLLGSTALLTFIDPYSIYTRFSSTILHPTGMAINNTLAHLFNAFDNYFFSSEENLMPELIAFLVTLISIATIVILTIKKDRFWCNAICPVGTLLGLMSRFSIFRVKIDRQKCVSCNKCAQECKSHAINIEDYSIDYSRCIACYNCIDECQTHQAINFTSAKLSLSEIKGVKPAKNKVKLS
jgi:polyferredoxin